MNFAAEGFSFITTDVGKFSTDVGKFSFVNRTIQLWNQLPAEVLETLPCKQITFKKRARKAIIEGVKGSNTVLEII
jgi:hypothetical protein